MNIQVQIFIMSEKAKRCTNQEVPTNKKCIFSPVNEDRMSESVLSYLAFMYLIFFNIRIVGERIIISLAFVLSLLPSRGM